ncbi:AI-2E family transporter [Chelativorans salis]|uniref:AI-2E family transporter n=1 Tax=Chelativorans salis TaxID=2978478 RepID=A0ABT2LSC5_9HYPH|nr:AI-2E family transporter [Chelativorans sp. EGI FJ00035]MCT7377432.1 AI-2E family transporter [Chelativorans sp. EGI FJ00035]
MTGKNSRDFAIVPWQLLTVGLVIAAALVAWRLQDLILLVFSSILVSIALTSMISFVERHARLNRTASFIIVTVALFVLFIVFFIVLGSQLQQQLVQLWNRLPELIRPVERWLGVSDTETWLAERAEAMMSQTFLLGRIAGLSSAAVGLLANVVLVLVAALYIAHRPELYRYGLVHLFPPRYRPHAEETFDAMDTGLRRWLMGQLLAMLLVGVLTYIGLRSLGVPSALALAVIAGVLEFIPFVGPILSAAPAIAIALAEGPRLALWVAALYLFIQQIEGNFLLPLIQEQAVMLPPAVTLFALLAFGILFGPLGVVLATPLAVLLLIAVKQLWVRDSLHEKVELPGEKVDDS